MLYMHYIGNIFKIILEFIKYKMFLTNCYHDLIVYYILLEI